MALLLRNGQLILEDVIVSGHNLAIWDGKIQEIITNEELNQRNLNDYQVIDLEGGFVSPGWIDIHCHGAMGSDVMDGESDGLRKIAKFKASQGTTGFVPTGITATFAEIEAAVEAVRELALTQQEGAKILGFHLEGPFINPEMKGAHQAELIVPVNISWTRKLFRRVTGRLIVTVAPEMEGAQDYIRQMSTEGVLLALGHSNGTYADIKSAYEAGASHGVHTFNGMRGLHHREPGVVGGILDLPLVAEVIADCIHVHPAIMRLLSRVKLPEQMVLITDAMRAAGLGDGEYDLGGLKVFKKGKEARLADGTLAGSTLTMQMAVWNMHHIVGLQLTDIMKMASSNPAKLLGVFANKGSIAVGKDADLTLLTTDLLVRETIIQGEVVWAK